MTILSDEDLVAPAPTPPEDRSYDAIEAVNWSTLVHLATSPKMLRWRLDHPRPDTREFQLGRAIHCAIFEPRRFASSYVVAPDFGNLREKASRTKRAEWLLDLPRDVEVMAGEEHALALRCAEAVLEHPIAADLLRGGRGEEVITWTDEETGLRCKGRVDWITPIWLLDLKSTRHTTLGAMGRDCASRLYHGQLAFYHRGAIAARVLPRDAELPRVILVQTVEPFDVAPARLSHEHFERGVNLCREFLGTYAACQLSDLWPGLAPGLIDLPLPAWTPGRELEPEGDEW